QPEFRRRGRGIGDRHDPADAVRRDLCRLAHAPPIRARMNASGKRWARRLPGRIALVLFLLFALVPFGWMLTASLEPQTSLYREQLSYLPDPLTFENYIALFRADPIAGTDFPRYFVNSLIVVICTVILSLLIAVPAAYGFSRYRFLGKDVI